jgi:hypothetical protein
MRYYVEVQYNSARELDRIQWADSRAGPFESVAEAVRVAKAECGLPWRVVDEDFDLNEMEYARGNEDRPPAVPPTCPACKSWYCQINDGRWACIDCGTVFAKDLQ